MSITYRAETTASGTGTLVLNKPTGTVDGDLLRVTILSDDKTATTAQGPAGWTKIDDVAHSGDAVQLITFYKVASGEGATFTFINLLTPTVGCCQAFYDSVGGGAWSLSAHNTNTAGIVATASNAAITSQNNSLLFISWGNDSLWTVSTAPTGMTASGHIDGAAMSLNPYYQLITTGASETKSLTWSGADNSIIFAEVWTYSVAAQSVDTVSATVVDGGTGYSGTYSGFTSAPTAAQIQNAAGTYATAVTSFSASGGSFTFNAGNVIAARLDNTVGSPFTSATETIYIKLYNGSESATKSLTYNPPASYTLVEATATYSIVTEGIISYGWSAAPTAGAQFVYPSSWNPSGSPYVFITASDGTINTDITTGTQTGEFWDNSDGKWKTFTVIFGSLSNKNIMLRRRRRMSRRRRSR